MRAVYAGVDVGGTGTAIALFSEDRAWLAESKFDTLGGGRARFGDPAAFIAETARRIESEVAALGGDAVLAGAGFGVPGQVDPDDGIVYDATNLGWRNVPFAIAMGERLGVPVRIDHDVRTFANGEMMAGAAAGYRNVLCLTIGTGIAAAFSIDGRLARGGRYSAGEIGHDTVPGLTKPCPCGKIGCLETVVSGPGIARLAAEAGLAGGVPCGKPTAEDVARSCDQGDRRAIEIYEYAAGLLADKLETAVALLDPEIIVVGGGVAAAERWLLEPIRIRLSERFPWLRGKMPVLRGTLGERAGLIGALNHVHPARIGG